MKNLNLLLFCLTSVLLLSCNEKSEKKLIVNENESVNQKNIDSIELTKLIRQVYEWHNMKPIDDFPYEYNENQDSIFIGSIVSRTIFRLKNEKLTAVCFNGYFRIFLRKIRC